YVKKDRDKQLNEKQGEKVKDEKEKEIIIFARDNVISALRETINVETTRSIVLLHKRLERAIGEDIKDIESDKLDEDQNSSKRKKQDKIKQNDYDEQNEIDSDISSYPICFAIEKPMIVTNDEEIQTIPKAASSNAATQTQRQVQIKIEREYKQDENKQKDEKTNKDKDKSKEKQKKKQKILFDEKIAVNSEQNDEKKVQYDLNAINSDNIEKVENINDNIQNEAENEIQSTDEQQYQESLASPQVTTQSEKTPQSIAVPQSILSVNSEQADQVNKKQTSKKVISLFEDEEEEQMQEQKAGKKKIDSLFGESQNNKDKQKAEEDEDEDGLGAVISFIKPPIVQKDSSSKSSKPDQTNSDSTIEQIIPNLTSSLSLSTKKDSEKNTSNNKQGKTGNIGKIKGKNAQGNNKGKSSSSNSGGLFDDDEDPLA
ncbi:MAG: hypothetical protein EZS28_019096, partial [Streblomastix strix]